MQGGNLGRKDFWRKMFKSQSAASDTSSQSEQDTSECTTAHSGNTSDRRARSRSRRISLRKKLKLPIGKSMSVFIYGFSYYHVIKSVSDWEQNMPWEVAGKRSIQAMRSTWRLHASISSFTVLLMHVFPKWQLHASALCEIKLFALLNLSRSNYH
jgi:hypothetical protein